MSEAATLIYPHLPSSTLLVGTAKGLLIYHKTSAAWEVEKVHFTGMPVSMVFADERNGIWWVGLTHRHWGQKLHFSKDFGKTWDSVPMPRYPNGAEFKPGKPASVRKIWCMAGGSTDRPGVLWLGTEPGGLFYSDDEGQNFHLVESLWNHPSRLNEQQWFGAGRDEPFIHSIVVNPRDSDHVFIAVSCAGVFETKDSGKHWQPRNRGLIAAYLPNPDVEVGHDPHLLLACRSNSPGSQVGVLWQQNHCGIFRSTNGGEDWSMVSDPMSMPHYGFALAIDSEDPLRAWVIPAVSDEERVPHDLALCVCRTEDGGKSWTPLRRGLPQAHCFDIVFRHSLARSGKTLAFGTTGGNLFLSENDGEEWRCLSGSLARVDYVAFAG